jgi:hypothetical protein
MTAPRSDPAFYAAEKYNAAQINATPGTLASADRERAAVAITLGSTVCYLPRFHALRLIDQILDAIAHNESKDTNK